MFSLTLSPGEIVLRGTLAFLSLVVLVRVVPKRNAGHISPNDMLILIVIGGIGADAIVGAGVTVGDRLLCIALVLGWGYLFDVLEYRVPFFRRVMRQPQSLLVQDGRLQRRNMRQEMVTEEELMAALRKEGVAELSEVASSWMEADGEISVVKKRPPDRN